MSLSLLSRVSALILAAAGPLHAIVIGVDQFDYPDGSLAGKSGGTFWNWRNRTPAARTAGTSDWDDTQSAPFVAFGRLVTQNSAVKREYNGPGEGDTVDIDRADGLGAISVFNNGTVSFSQKVVYYRVTLWTGASVNPDTRFGISTFDFGTERLFFGKRPGEARFVIGEPDGGSTAGGAAIQPSTSYTIVAKLDFGDGTSGTASFFVNPDFSAGEPATPLVTRPFNASFWSTAVSLSSGGGSPVIWDDLVVGTTWRDLGTVVTITGDEDDGLVGGSVGVSLREAVKYSPPGSLVTFAPDLSGQTITLAHYDGHIPTGNTVTVDATGLPGGFTVDGNNDSPHFLVGTGQSLTLRGLTLTGGNSSGLAGGSIYSQGTLRLHHCNLMGNASDSEGGAVYIHSGTLSATCCTFAGNRAGDSAISINSATGILSRCTVTGNHSTGLDSTGGISISPGVLDLEHCTIARNTGNGAGGGFRMRGNTSLVNIHSSIIAGNSDPGGPGRDVFRQGTGPSILPAPTSSA